MTIEPSTDPILVQRARWSRRAEVGQRVGYALYGVAMAVFLGGLFTDFTTTIARVIIAAIIVGSFVLAPAIIAGYAVKAAIRDDIEHGRRID